jgi:hypothetical protein
LHQSPRATKTADTDTKIGTSYANKYKSEGVAGGDERSKFWTEQQAEDNERAKELQEQADAAQREVEADRRRLEQESEQRRAAMDVSALGFQR